MKSYSATVLTNTSCNLSCAYCYEHDNKNIFVNSTSDALDFFAAMEKLNPEKEECVAELIGGEPFLAIDLLEEITAKIRRLESRKKYRAAITTNGTLLGQPRVRKYIEANKDILVLAVSIDGIKEVHDKQRCNSYDLVVENLPWLFSVMRRCNVGCKATFTTESFVEHGIQSYINLIKLGFREINGNIAVEEKVSLEEGIEVAVVFVRLCDYLIENNLETAVKIPVLGELEHLRNYNYRLFAQAPEEPKNFCGTCTYMKCLGRDRRIYGCHRFCVTNQLPIGILTKDNEIQITEQKLFDDISRQYERYPNECMSCKIRNQCPACIALNHQTAMASAKNMCGWAYGLALARFYMCLKLARKERNI
jgi:radical SAM protein with 4Fe4S-binding SPASM domain